MNPEDAVAGHRRRGLLMALLPGLVLACGYAVGYRSRMVGAIARLEGDLVEVRQQVPADFQIRAASDHVEALRAQVNAIRARRGEGTAARVALNGSVPQVEGAVATLVTALLRGGMTLVSEQPGNSRIAESAGRITGAVPQRVRKIELSGTYSQMLRTLRELESVGTNVKVLELHMNSDGKREGVTSWILTVG